MIAAGPFANLAHTSMRVGIDIRPLLEPKRSGVSIYTAGMVRALAARGNHRYSLFCNAFAAGVPADVPAESAHVRHAFYRFPNKLLNAGFAFTGRPKADRLAGGIDCMYLPNLNFIATDAPIVVTIHDLSFVRYPRFFSTKQRLWHALVNSRKIVSRAAKIVAVSTHTKADIVETYGVPEDRVVVAHPAADARFRPQSGTETERVRMKYCLRRPFFLLMGSIEPRKNIEGAIAAYERVGGDAELVIAGGSGWLNGRVFAAAASSPKRDRIRFLGYVEEDDKPALYSAAAALVYPSFYEGFGIPPLEAMACGTPVIASHATSLGEVVGDAGILVDPYSARDIAEAMTAALDDEPLMASLRRRGIERAKRFTWDESAKTLETVFAGLG